MPLWSCRPYLCVNSIQFIQPDRNNNDHWIEEVLNVYSNLGAPTLPYVQRPLNILVMPSETAFREPARKIALRCL
jgi:hypothetical protein